MKAFEQSFMVLLAVAMVIDEALVIGVFAYMLRQLF